MINCCQTGVFASCRAKQTTNRPFSHAEYGFSASLQLNNKTQRDGWDLQVLAATYVWVDKGLQIPIQFAVDLGDVLAPKFYIHCLQITSFGASSSMGGPVPNCSFLC